MIECPKCRHIRQPADPGPDYECPRCGIVYAKFKAPEPPPQTPTPVPPAVGEARPAAAQAKAPASPATGRFIVIAALLILGYNAVVSYNAVSRGEPRRAEPAREIVSNRAWDGSVYQVEDWLKSNLKDPASFEAIEWSSVVKGDSGFFVRCKYRAKNSFGGYVIEHKVFALDANGKVITVTDFM